MYKNGQTDGKRNRHKRSTAVHLKYPPVCWQYLSPRHNVSVLMTCGRCHRYGLIVVSLREPKGKLLKLYVKILAKRKTFSIVL